MTDKERIQQQADKIRELTSELSTLANENEVLRKQNRDAAPVMRFVKDDCKESVRYKLGLHKADPPSAECVREWNDIEKMTDIESISVIAQSNWSASTPQPTKPRTKMSGANNL